MEMIKIVKGDLLKAKEHIIAHQVNAQGKMGSGVAEQVRKVYPVAYEKYKELVEQTVEQNGNSEALMGEIQGIRIGFERYVVNMFGQYNYGYDGGVYTNTESLYKCFKRIRAIAEKNHLSVAMPYMIGCYRGGADWKEVEDLLLTAFDGYEVTLYKLHKG